MMNFQWEGYMVGVFIFGMERDKWRGVYRGFG